MSNFIDTNIDQLGTLVQDASKALPSTLSSSVGNLVGQAGNSRIINEINKLAGNPQGPNGSLIQQQSAFPYRKLMTFYLKDRNGQLIHPSDKNFQPGYLFKMRINPSSFAVTLPPKSVTQIRTMGGWKLQYWYPEIGSIRAEGTIGNMLGAFNRDLKDSEAWRNFKNLMAVYVNNGIPYTAPGKSQRQAAQAQFAPTAVCLFDNFQYEGYFESLEYTENQDTPHTIGYSFSFKFLNNLNLGDIPGITRESTIDANYLNAIVPQSKINSLIQSI